MGVYPAEIFARHVIVVLQDAERVRSELDALQGLRTGHVAQSDLDRLADMVSKVKGVYEAANVEIAADVSPETVAG